MGDVGDVVDVGDAVERTVEQTLGDKTWTRAVADIPRYRLARDGWFARGGDLRRSTDTADNDDSPLAEAGSSG